MNRFDLVIARGSMSLALAGLLMACAHNPPPGSVNPNDPQVAVPDARARVQANTSDEGWAAKLRRQTVCLIRSGTAAGCGDGEEAMPTCDPRSAAEVDTTLQPLFQALPRITLASRFTAPDSIHAVLPGVLVTRAVQDARRETSCTDWQNGPPCVALRTAEVWAVLYRTERAPGPVQHVEILLATPPCRSDVHP
jgi:hypothetical protein